MVIRVGLTALAAAVLLSGAAGAAESYRPGQYLNLDSRALTAPAPLGPAGTFEAVPGAEATVAAPPAQAPAAAVQSPTAAAEPPAVDAPAPVAETAPPVVTKKPARATAAKPQPRRPAHVARSRSNPLDAQARDTRPSKPRAAQSGVQTWPCRSGAMCQWQR